MIKKSIFNNSYFKILDCLESANKDGIFLQSGFNMSENVFLKHITNLRKAGFKIIKKNNLYFLDKYYGSLLLNNIEKSLLAHILTLSDTHLNKKSYKNIDALIKKISHLSTLKNYDEVIEKYTKYKKFEFYNTYNEKIDLLSKYANNKEEITITLRSKKEITTIVTNLIWKNNKLYATYQEENKNRTLSIEKIIKILPKNTPKETIRSTEVFFELYGHLAKSYLLKKEERIVDILEDKIIIANSQKDKNILFRRLLRYDTLCKVILPKSDVEDFKKIITSAIENLSTLDIETT